MSNPTVEVEKGGSQTQSQSQSQQRFYMVMEDQTHGCCLYGLSEAELEMSPSDQMLNLPEPLLRLKKKIYPQGMSFGAVGGRIFMVGGMINDGGTIIPGKGPCKDTNKVFIYDTLTCQFSPGPSLNSAKFYPVLFVVGSDIYALSRQIYAPDKGNTSIDRMPRFEVLNTAAAGCQWVGLPLPDEFHPRGPRRYTHRVVSSVVWGKRILISVKDAGTYSFNVVKKRWKFVSEEQLPFEGRAWCFDDGLCRAPGGKAYRFHRQPKGVFPLLSVSQVGVGTTGVKLDQPRAPLPRLFCVRPSPLAYGKSNRVYHVTCGVDNFLYMNYREPANRYLEMYAYEVCRAEVKKKKKKNKGGEKKRRKTEFQDEEVGSSGAKEFLIKPLWRRSIFAGPMSGDSVDVFLLCI